MSAPLEVPASCLSSLKLEADDDVLGFCMSSASSGSPSAANSTTQEPRNAHGCIMAEDLAPPVFGRSDEPDSHDSQPVSLDDTKLFFGNVLRSSTEEAVLAIFAPYGVKEIILFRAYKRQKGCGRGCGLITMVSHEAAVAAIENLHNKYTQAGMRNCMVVRWMDKSLQQPRRGEASQTDRSNFGWTTGPRSFSLMQDQFAAMRQAHLSQQQVHPRALGQPGAIGMPPGALGAAMAAQAALQMQLNPWPRYAAASYGGLQAPAAPTPNWQQVQLQQQQRGMWQAPGHVPPTAASLQQQQLHLQQMQLQQTAALQQAGALNPYSNVAATEMLMQLAMLQQQQQQQQLDLQGVAMHGYASGPALPVPGIDASSSELAMLCNLLNELSVMQPQA